MQRFSGMLYTFVKLRLKKIKRDTSSEQSRMSHCACERKGVRGPVGMWESNYLSSRNSSVKNMIPNVKVTAVNSLPSSVNKCVTLINHIPPPYFLLSGPGQWDLCGGHSTNFTLFFIQYLKNTQAFCSEGQVMRWIFWKAIILSNLITRI